MNHKVSCLFNARNSQILRFVDTTEMSSIASPIKDRRFAFRRLSTKFDIKIRTLKKVESGKKHFVNIVVDVF